MANTFADFQALNSSIHDEGKGARLITYRNIQDYVGMVLGIMLVFDTKEAQYELDLQWMSFGLDPYGDTLQESYVYGFENLEKLLDYLDEKYSIAITDIPIKYSIDPSEYPDPISNELQRPLFEASWKKFQVDFKQGKFLDTSLKLTYRSDEA